MTISIALCTYNGEAYLAQQLDSIARQTRPPDELVICDDCSTDGTSAMLESFAAAAPFPVRLRRNPRNTGSTPNFEQAIGLCSGEIIALADQDDVWLPHKLALIEAAFARHSQAGLVFSDADVVDDRLHSLGYTLWQSRRFSARLQARMRAGDAVGVLLRQNYVTGATMAFRACWRSVVLPISPLWVHDAWIALMLALYAPAALIGTPLIRYRQHTHNQIGGAQRTARQWAVHPRQPDALARTAQRYRAFLTRVQSLDDLPQRALVEARLRAKIAHAEARACLPARRVARLPGVVSELVAGRYHRYSLGGTLAAIHDLLAAAGNEHD
jgi:hypothetical protein